MRISLIGMSGSGKSTWSGRLVENGFKVFHCDDLIAEKLSNELKKPDGTDMEVGEWMGFPHEPTYIEREEKYLYFEKKVLAEILNEIETVGESANGRIVIDTTGSVIYTGEAILKTLGRMTRVVHLAIPPEVQELMLNAYLSNMRPVLWRSYFNVKSDESHEAALARCYPMLLSGREELYARHADVTLDYYKHSSDDFNEIDFLNMVMDLQEIDIVERVRLTHS